jgi:SAM-dependent methyltransferase
MSMSQLFVSHPQAGLGVTGVRVRLVEELFRILRECPPAAEQDAHQAHPMKLLDRVLQAWRIPKAEQFIAPGSRVLDIGSHDGVLFRALGSRISSGLGIDPALDSPRRIGNASLVRGFFPDDMPEAEPFDVVTMLAVLEHFPASRYAVLREGCARFLKPGGHLIITVPSPLVDRILDVLRAMRLVEGMSLEEHHGFQVRQTPEVFPLPEFELIYRERFQLGLNNLFVFRRRRA